MRDYQSSEYPEYLGAIISETKSLGFDMASEPKTGALLRTLVASKPRGQFLEIGTGTGLATAWILSGMDSDSTLTTIDIDPESQGVAIRSLGKDPRLNFVCADGDEWLEQNQNERYDLIFADAWPGKFSNLEFALNLVKYGGMYVIDDLLPQESWPEGHAPRVPELLNEIESRPEFTSVRMAWASGLMVAVKIAVL